MPTYELDTHDLALIVNAVEHERDYQNKEAASHKWSGLRYADHRRGLRARAKELQGILDKLAVPAWVENARPSQDPESPLYIP